MDCHQPDAVGNLLATKDREFAFTSERYRSEDEWLEARRRGIGASDAAIVLGLEKRESPLTLAHLRAMTAVTEMGGIIMPPVPAFYLRPKSVTTSSPKPRRARWIFLASR